MHSDVASNAAASPHGQGYWLPKLAGWLRHPILQNDGNVSIDRLVRTGHAELQSSQRSFDQGHRNRGHMHAQSASQLLRRAIDRAAIAEAPLDAEVYAELAEAYALLGQAPEEAPTDDPGYWDELARHAIGEARWGEARVALLHLHAVPEHAAAALDMLDAVSQQDGQWEAALELPEAHAVWHPLGVRALATGQVRAAVALWAAAAHNGAMQQAADSALALCRDADGPTRQLGAGLVLALGPSVRHCCAAALEALSFDLTLARRLIQRAEGIADAADDTDNAEDEGALESTCHAMLQTLLARGRYDGDVVGLMQVLRTDDAALLFELGVAVGDAGLHADAYGLLRRAANLAPPTVAGYTLLADAARAAGRPSDVSHWTSMRRQANRPMLWPPKQQPKSLSFSLASQTRRWQSDVIPTLVQEMAMKKALATLCVVASMQYAPLAAAHEDDLPVIEDLEMSKLFGHYYEIATYLQWIESGCSNSAVTFDDPVKSAPKSVAQVTIECDRNGGHQAIKGNAVPLDDSTLARTEVTFKGPLGRKIKQEFDVIMTGVPDTTSSEKGYPWVVIGHPSRRQLWIISRTADLPTTTLTYILDKLETDFGYTNVHKNLTCTEHDDVPEAMCNDALQTLTAWDENWLL